VDKQSLTNLHDVVASSLSSINVKNLPCYKLRTIEAEHGEDHYFEYKLRYSRPCDQMLFRVCNKRRLRSNFWG
jgi:hypothetical protein